jgi:hypothetical protein
MVALGHGLTDTAHICVPVQDCVFPTRPGYADTNWHIDLWGGLYLGCSWGFANPRHQALYTSVRVCAGLCFPEGTWLCGNQLAQ